jgi:hypothetical protein
VQSFDHLKATLAMFEQLKLVCPSIQQLLAFSSLFVDDDRSLTFPAPVYRPLKATPRAGLDGCLKEGLTGFGTCDACCTQITHFGVLIRDLW